MRTTIDRASKEFIHVPVSAPPGVDLSDLPVSIALVVDRPEDDDFQPAAWAGNTAILLVGPMEPGTYKVYVKITDAPEVPVLPAGLIKVT